MSHFDWVLFVCLRKHTRGACPHNQQEEEEDEEGAEEAVGQLLGHVLEQAENFSGVSKLVYVIYAAIGWVD